MSFIFKDVMQDWKEAAFSFFFVLFCVLLWKQSAANSFGQMQIASLTPQPESILQHERATNARRRKEGWRKKKTSAGFTHLCQTGRARPAVRGGSRERERGRSGGWRKREEEEEMEARCPRQRMPGITISCFFQTRGNVCIIMMGGRGGG